MWRRPKCRRTKPGRSRPSWNWLVLLLAFNAGPATAGRPLNPVTDIAWHEIFPISIAGITVQGNDSTSPSGFSAIASPVCTCPAPPPVFRRVGIPVGLWEPARLVETVKDAGYFPSLGVTMDLSGHRDGSRGSHASGATTTAFQQAHYLIFPVWTLLELMLDNVCLESSGFDVAYMSELDPLWQEDALAMMIHPEVLLFANAAAQLACVADAVGAAADHPLDPLFWCVGSGGSVYPLSGHVSGNNFTVANATLAARMLYKLARQLQVCDTGVNVCSCVPTPIWIKSHYKMQIARPVRGSGAFPIGQSDFLWGSMKNPPMGAGPNDPDNFLWVLFRKRMCCIW
ncbi:MAG: TraU family protein [Deferrisomatales bacterium]|nr:TraU family protein [Deferrisomatales bacterium]